MNRSVVSKVNLLILIEFVLQLHIGKVLTNQDQKEQMQSAEKKTFNLFNIKKVFFQDFSERSTKTLCIYSQGVLSICKVGVSSDQTFQQTPCLQYTANIFNIILTVFKCVPFSTVISLCGLDLIAAPHSRFGHYFCSNLYGRAPRGPRGVQK